MLGAVKLWGWWWVVRLQGNQIQKGFQSPCGGVSFSSTEQQGDVKSKANMNSGETPSCEETSYFHSFHYFSFISISSPLHQIEYTCLFLPTISCVSFLVVLESFFQYPEDFSMNGFMCRCIFDVFLVGMISVSSYSTILISILSQLENT